MEIQKKTNLKEQNILFFSRSTQYGGTEKVILQLCKIFKPYVNKIVVCAAGKIGKQELENLDVKFYEIPDIEQKDIATIVKVSRELRRIVDVEQITVIHTHHRMAAFYVSMLRLYKKRAFINTSHNTFTNKKLLTRFAYRHAHLIACGKMVKRNLVDVYGIPDDQVTVIHNAVEPFEGNQIIDPLIKQFHDEGDFVIGNIGRLSKQKGMEYFINAIPKVIEMCPNARFVIAGSGEEEDKLKELSKTLQLDSYLTFLGYRNDIQNLMSQLDLIVLSSLWEGLPLTPIEAFSVGKTVVATAVDGTVEIVRDGVDGILIEPRNSAQLAERICWMIENPVKRKNMEQRAFERYHEEFSFEKLKNSYVECYSCKCLENLDQ